MVFIGIDPGLNGACAVLNNGSLTVLDAPTIEVKGGKKSKRELVPQQMADLLRGYTGSDTFVTIELVSSMPGQGVTSCFSFGKGFGMWQGVLAGLGIPFQLVSPVRWKRAILADSGKEKDAARFFAMRLFPQAAELFKRKKDDGRAEAALIAEYGRRVYTGTPQ